MAKQTKKQKAAADYNWIVYDCYGSQVIGKYKSKYWAAQRANREMRDRNLTYGIIVQERWDK
jgi:hypothetical protein